MTSIPDTTVESGWEHEHPAGDASLEVATVEPTLLVDGTYEPSGLDWVGHRRSANQLLLASRIVASTIDPEDHKFPLGFYFATGPVGEESELIQLVASLSLVGASENQANWLLTLPRNDILAVDDTTSRYPNRRQYVLGCRRYGIHVAGKVGASSLVAVSRTDEGRHDEAARKQVGETEGSRVAQVAARICIRNINDYVNASGLIRRTRQDLLDKETDEKKRKEIKNLQYAGKSVNLPVAELILPEAEIAD